VMTRPLCAGAVKSSNEANALLAMIDSAVNILHDAPQ
jgi:hypothetical protein